MGNHQRGNPESEFGEHQSYEAGQCPVSKSVEARLLHLRTSYWDRNPPKWQAQSLARIAARIG